MKTDILFIHPGNQKRIYQDLSNNLTAVATPVWTSLLANAMRQKGYGVAIYDANVDGWDDKAPAEILPKYNPELIVIMVYGHTPSASTQTMPAARMIASDIKKYNADARIALGGIHPSSLPERTMNEEPADFVLQGEGLYSIEGLIQCLRGKLDRDKVPGLWYRRDGKVIQGSVPAKIVEDLDRELPGYAWDLLPDLGRYRAHNMHCFQDFEKSRKDDFSDVRSPYATLNTSLGCPYSCNYCCINAIFGKPGIRYWSLGTVMTWLEALVKQGVRNIRFDDELFILSPKRVEQFCDMLIERKWNLNIWVYGRVDTVKPALLSKLKKAGINWICLGIESANELVRNGVNKQIRRDIRAIVKDIQAADIYVLGNYMLGLPEDTRETMEETLKLADDLNCEFANFYSVMALPGSRLYDEACAKGWLPPMWGGFSQFSPDCQPIPTKHISWQEVLKFRDGAFSRHFSRPTYLSMIEKRFGPRTASHIRQMLEIKVKREWH